MGVVGSNGSEAGGSSCGVPDTGDKFECKKAEGRLVVEGGGKNIASGSRDTTATDLLGKEAGNSGVMGGFTTYFRVMREGDGLRGRGETLGAVVETRGSRKTAEGHVKIYFGSGDGNPEGVVGAREGRGGGGVTDGDG